MINIDSSQQLSALLFGGELKEEVVEPVFNVDGIPVVFKSGSRQGQIKTHKVTKIVKIKGLGLNGNSLSTKNKNGSYCVDEETLVNIKKQLDRAGIKEDAYNIISNILVKRKLSKQLSTYYDNVLALIYPDGVVRPSFIHFNTDTGRLSSSAPNIQNQPKSFESNVRQHFVSRFEDGVLIEADYQQLELVVQSQLSGDIKYIEDVKNGIDFHCKRLALKEGIPYEQIIKKIKIDKDEVWIEKRSKIKEFSFSRSYGAEAWSISQKIGFLESEVQDLIDKEDLEYAGLTKYNLFLKEFVEYTAKKNGGQRGFYRSFTGKQYWFTKGKYGFKFPEIKNYIVQGTSADIVLIMLGKFFREAMKHRDKFLLINTVHDSILLDCKKEYVKFACNLLKSVLESSDEVLKKEFDINWKVPFKVDIKIGNSWWECGK